MKEFEYPIDISGGIRKFKARPRNSKGLVDCRNLMPVEEGYEIHEVITLVGATATNFLLLESGSYFLLESGSKLII